VKHEAVPRLKDSGAGGLITNLLDRPGTDVGNCRLGSFVGFISILTPETRFAFQVGN